MTNPSARRVGEIELFRFIFSVAILLRHAEYLFGENLVFAKAAFGVEFFFLVSGYLMMASIDRVRLSQGNTCPPPVDTWHYLCKKVSSLYLEVFLSYVIGFLAICLLQSLNFMQAMRKLSNAAFELLLIGYFGLGGNSVNVPIWYVQSMLMCMAILYPLNRKYPDAMKYIVMPLTALFILGYLCQTCKTLRDPSIWLGVTYKGNLRAMAELCLGAQCYYITQKFSKIPLKKFAKILLTGVKWACWIGLLVYMWDGKTKYDFSMLVVFLVAIILAFSRQCVDTEVYDTPKIFWLGKFSLCVYLAHMPFATSLATFLPENMRWRYMLLIYVVCSLTLALVVMWLSRLIRRYELPKKLAGIFVE